MIDTDTRQLRRDNQGFYKSGSGKNPCDHCGHIASCSAKPLATCSDFLPAIPFTSDEGMDHVFNTVRIGRAWVDRLHAGQLVALYNTKTKVVFGHARVLNTFAGPIDTMLAMHAHANHLMLDKDQADAASILFDWQRRNYGPRIVHETASITAIYFFRDYVTDPQTLLRRGKANGDDRGRSEDQG